MGRLKRSWAIFKSSFRVLKGNKKLLIFPAIASIGVLGIIVFFLAVSTSFTYESKVVVNGDRVDVKTDNAFMGTLYKYCKETDKKKGSHKVEITSPYVSDMSKGESENMFSVPLLIILYMFSMFLATFFNVAFYSEIMRALNGSEVSIMRGFKFACSKIVPILMWSLFAGIVGYIIQAISEKLGFIGKIVMSLIGMAWSVASVFAIPVIIREENNINPLDYLKKSALTIKKTWGEGLVGYLGFGGLSLIVVLSSMFLFLLPLVILSIVLFKEGALVPVLSVCGVWVIMLIAYSYIVGVAEKIYLCSLYVYASEGVVPEHFSTEDMNSAWKVKKTN